jgi:hypothetical protein
MDVGTLTLGGVIGQQSDGGKWSTNQIENDTLTIKPQSVWTIGTDKISIGCNDSEGKSLPTTELTYGVQIVYVKAGATGDGTMDNPMGNINDAITQAINTWPMPSHTNCYFLSAASFVLSSRVSAC